jgi:hypothetical protein
MQQHQPCAGILLHNDGTFLRIPGNVLFGV